MPTRHPPGQAKPGATSNGGDGGSRETVALTPASGIARPQALPCCKHMFQVFQMFRRHISIVSCGCCRSRSWSCICCNNCTRMLQGFVSNVSFVFLDVCCKWVYPDVANVLSRCCICLQLFFQVYLHVFQTHVSNVLAISYVCCNSVIWMFQKHIRDVVHITM
jgi:hypothetical protein